MDAIRVATTHISSHEPHSASVSLSSESDAVSNAAVELLEEDVRSENQLRLGFPKFRRKLGFVSDEDGGSSSDFGTSSAEARMDAEKEASVDSLSRARGSPDAADSVLPPISVPHAPPLALVVDDKVVLSPPRMVFPSSRRPPESSSSTSGSPDALAFVAAISSPGGPGSRINAERSGASFAGRSTAGEEKHSSSRLLHDFQPSSHGVARTSSERAATARLSSNDGLRVDDATQEGLPPAFRLPGPAHVPTELACPTDASAMWGSRSSTGAPWKSGGGWVSLSKGATGQYCGDSEAQDAPKAHADVPQRLAGWKDESDSYGGSFSAASDSVDYPTAPVPQFERAAGSGRGGVGTSAGCCDIEALAVDKLFLSSIGLDAGETGARPDKSGADFSVPPSDWAASMITSRDYMSDPGVPIDVDGLFGKLDPTAPDIWNRSSGASSSTATGFEAFASWLGAAGSSGPSCCPSHAANFGSVDVRLDPWKGASTLPTGGETSWSTFSPRTTCAADDGAGRSRARVQGVEAEESCAKGVGLVGPHGELQQPSEAASGGDMHFAAWLGLRPMGGRHVDSERSEATHAGTSASKLASAASDGRSSAHQPRNRRTGGGGKRGKGRVGDNSNGAVSSVPSGGNGHVAGLYITTGGGAYPKRRGYGGGNYATSSQGGGGGRRPRGGGSKGGKSGVGLVSLLSAGGVGDVGDSVRMNRSGVSPFGGTGTSSLAQFAVARPPPHRVASAPAAGRVNVPFAR